MLKIIETSNTAPNTIPMHRMKPLQVGQVYKPNNEHHNKYVVRAPLSTHFQVIDLSNPGVDSSWITKSTLPVRLLGPGEKLTIELSN